MITNITKLLIITIIIFATNNLYGQHPNLYLKDVYNVEWCQNTNVQSIVSKSDNYVLRNGVMISDKAENFSVENEGRKIRYTYGKGTIEVAVYLTSDLKRLKEMRLGPNFSYFHYDEQKLLSHKISINQNELKNYESNGPIGNMLEDLTRDSKGRLIKKSFYDYYEPILEYRNDLKKLRSMDRVLRMSWDYSYAEDGKIKEIAIERYSYKTKEIESNYIVIPEYENELPVLLKIGEGEEGNFIVKSKRKFKYSESR